MGSPKALLPFDDQPLIVHILRTLNELFSETIVVAAPEQELPALPVKLVRDETAYQGPVGGIYYGLKSTGGEFSFVTSCDVAFLNSQLICYLVSEIANYDVVVPYWDGRFQPLHAVYRRSVVPLLEKQLERGELRPIYLFDNVRTRKITADEIRRFDPEGFSFLNMNTPEDYRTALQLWREIRQRGNTDTAPSETRQRRETETAPPNSVYVSIPVSERSVTCLVELFGAAQLLAKTHTVSVSLRPPATLADAFMEITKQFPVLAGRVVDTERKTLNSGYACNINGLDFIRDPGARITSGDRILILAADAGG
jgi:molybdenum cofactor guanylyltransferase